MGGEKLVNINFTLIGLGKLGAPIAAAIASTGHRVTGVDQNEEVVHKINAGIAPVDESGLQAILHDVGDSLIATMNLEDALKSADVVGILVPTPSKKDGTFSSEYVLTACKQIGKSLSKRNVAYPLLISVMSTLMPGSMRKQVIPTLEKAIGSKCGEGWNALYTPELVAIGNVVNSFLLPDVVIIGEGLSGGGTKLADMLYEVLLVSRATVNVMPFACAEIAKMAINTFVATKITTANLVSDMCERYPGGDVDLVTRAMGMDSRIGSQYLTAGPPYGGTCFPRDVRAFEELADSLQLQGEMPWGVGRTNRIRTRQIAAKVECKKGDTVAIFGIAFKPGTGCTDGSPSLLLAEWLEREGCTVVGWDPLVASSASMDMWTMEKCLRKADAIVIMNREDAVVQLTHESFLNRKKPLFILDCWRVLRNLLYHAKDGPYASALQHVRYRGLGLRDG